MIVIQIITWWTIIIILAVIGIHLYSGFKEWFK